MSNLDRDLAEANRLGYGVWYGRYKADHPGEPVAAKPVVVEEVTEADLLDGICEICGKPFRKYNSQQKRCSGGCSEVAHRRMMAEKYRKKNVITEKLTCPKCAAVFLPVHRSQKYCCRSCQRKEEYARKRMKRSKEDNK